MFDKILNNIIPKPYEKPVTWEAFSNIKDYYLYCFEEHEDKLTAYLSANQLTGKTSTSMTKGILECVITTNEDRYGNLKAALNNSAYEGLLLTTERKTDFGVFELADKNYMSGTLNSVGVRAGIYMACSGVTGTRTAALSLYNGDSGISFSDSASVTSSTYHVWKYSEWDITNMNDSNIKALYSSLVSNFYFKLSITNRPYCYGNSSGYLLFTSNKFKAGYKLSYYIKYKNLDDISDNMSLSITDNIGVIQTGAYNNTSTPAILKEVILPRDTTSLKFNMSLTDNTTGGGWYEFYLYDLKLTKV